MKLILSRKIIDSQFRIGQAIVEFPPEAPKEVCEKHQSTIQRVNINSDRGRRISLEPIMGTQRTHTQRQLLSRLESYRHYQWRRNSDLSC